MPVYGKILKQSSSLEAIVWWPWNLICSIVYARTTKVVQIMTLGWPWTNLHQGQIWPRRFVRESEKYLFFGKYCSLRSQSCLKHSAKWVNEVEWVSKVKVILWPWSKVTQISKWNVWLWPVYSGERFRASLFSFHTANKHYSFRRWTQCLQRLRQVPDRLLPVTRYVISAPSSCNISNQLFGCAFLCLSVCPSINTYIVVCNLR